MRRLECIAFVLLVLGALPMFPATISEQIGDEGLERSAGSFPSTFTILGFQAFGIIGTLQDVRFEQGLGGSVASIDAFNNTDELQIVGAGQTVSVSVAGGPHFFSSADGSQFELGPGESGTSGDSGSEVRISGEFPPGPFLPAEVELIRTWETDIINPGIPMDVSFDYGFNVTLDFDYIPGPPVPEPAQLFPVALGICVFVIRWSRRSAGRQSVRP